MRKIAVSVKVNVEMSGKLHKFRYLVTMYLVLAAVLRVLRMATAALSYLKKLGKVDGRTIPTFLDPKTNICT